MSHFEPTLGAGVTGICAREFVKSHMGEFWAIFKPLFPFIAGLHLLDAVVADAFSFENGFFIGGVIALYFSTVLAISWHRVVIQGPDNYTPMNPFNPQRHEWAFIGMGIATFCFVFLVAFVSVYGAASTESLVMVGLAAIVTLFAMYFSYRLSFYFPAKAVNAEITVDQAFCLTKGYVLKLLGATLAAAWPIVLAVIVWGIIAGVLVSILPSDNAMNTVGFIMALPMTTFFQPVMTVLGVTVLSNYYLYSLQNDSRSVEIGS